MDKSRENRENFMTSADILKRRGWTWPMIHRLLKTPDRITYLVADRKEVKAYRLLRVKAAEQSEEFKAAQVRREKRPLSSRQRAPGGRFSTYTPPAPYRTGRKKPPGGNDTSSP